MKPFFERCFPRAAAEGRAAVLGILNATPDSFSDGGAFCSPENAVAHARQLIRDGADAIDIGAESTRPGFSPVGADEQKRRLLPVLRAVRAAIPGAVVSVDTRSPEVAAAALEEGADIINDQGGLALDAMLATAVARRAPVVAMHGFEAHSRGLAGPQGVETPGAWVARGLAEIAHRAESHGIAAGSLCLDPGFGFGLKGAQNAALLDALPMVAAAVSPLPLLVGPSRKHFLPGMYPGEAGPDDATARFCADAVRLGARIVRVHAPKPVVAAMRGALPPPARLGSTTSTNDDAMRLAREGAPDGTCVVAETQTAGRGRAGHSWASPPGVSLYFSIVLRPALEPDSLALATIATGVAVASAIRETTGLDARIKWPNDVLVSGRKCAGLLCEADVAAADGPVIVAGIGINVNGTASSLPHRPIFPATTLASEAGRPFDRDCILSSCRLAVARWTRVLEAPGGRDAVLRSLESLDDIRGRAVCVALPSGQALSGVAAGIDEGGRLLVSTAAGADPVPVVAGSVSL